MKTYTITRCPEGGPDWSAVPALHVEEALWLPPADIRMSVRLCYDGDALYVCQRAEEAHIRAEHRAPFSMVCEDSCMEFFFSPREGDPRFFNFECNPNGCTFIGIETSCHDIVRLAPLDEAALFRVRTRRFEGGWELDYRIPHEFVRLFFPDYRPAPGRQLRANCYKCGDLTVQPHYMAWSPVRTAEPDFHQSPYFGVMTFA